MEEKTKKVSSEVAILIVALILVVIVLSAVLIYKFIGENNEKDKMKEINNNDQNITINEQINSNIIESTIKNIILNNSNTRIKIEIENKEAIIYEEDLYKLKYDIEINGKKVLDIKDSSGGILWQNYNIEKIKDANNNKEYIVLKIYKNSIAGSRGIYLYIIDENANILGKLENAGGTSYIVGVVKDDEGNITDYEDTSGEDIRVIENQIIYYVDINSGVEKHKYTINDGKFTDSLVKTYNNNEVERAGKTA